MSVRLERDVHEALKAIADREHRTISGQLRKLIDDAVHSPELEQAA